MPDYLQDKFLFEPSANTKKAWLSTRKKSMYVGRLTLPGLFQTTDFEKDQKWLNLAIFIELIAVGLTIWGGIELGGMYLLGAIVTVSFIIILDIVGAIFVHKPKGDKCLIRNEIVITTELPRKEGLRNELNKVRLIEIVGVACILISAVLKVGAVLLLGTLPIFFYVIISILYLLVIYIHINHTGYCISEYSLISQIKKQHAAWAKYFINHAVGEDELGNPFNARELTSVFKLNISLFEGDHQGDASGHSISKRKSDNNGFEYKLTTKGILLDEDIRLLTNGLHADSSETIATYCLIHQIKIIL